MKTKHILSPFLMASSLVLTSGAYAIDWNDRNDDEKTGFYLGANYGGFKSRGGEFEDDNDFFQFTGGYKFSPYIGAEVDYSNFGEYGGDVASAELDGWGASLLGFLPVTDTLDLYAKAGVFMSSVNVEVVDFDEDFDDEQVFFGVGAEFDLTDMVSLVLEYNRYKIEVDDSDFPVDLDSSDTDIDTLKVGAKFYF